MREIHVADGVAFVSALDATAMQGVSIVSSLPDVSEVGLSFARWQTWFVDVTAQLMRAVLPGALLVLVQTDTRKDGAWVDKAGLVSRGIIDGGGMLLEKRIILRKELDDLQPSTARAAFQTMLVAGRAPLSVPSALPDVIVEAGHTTWNRGLGHKTTWACLSVVLRHASAPTTILDPFCGEGLLLAQANARGLRAIGVERNQKRAKAAVQMRCDPSTGEAL
jgi:hypothetical protein